MIINPVKFCEQLKMAELGFIPDYRLGPWTLLEHLTKHAVAVPGIKKQHLKNLKIGRALLTENDAYYLAQTFPQTTIETWLKLEHYFRNE